MSSKLTGIWQAYNGQIMQMRNQGLNLRAVGKKIGVSGERIRQLLKKHYGRTTIHGYLTRKQLAQLIGCSEGILVYYESKGWLAPLHSGGRYLYDRDEAEKAMLQVMKPKSRQPDVERVCRVCGVHFFMRPYDIKPESGSPANYCSRRCQGTYLGTHYGRGKRVTTPQP